MDNRVLTMWVITRVRVTTQARSWCVAGQYVEGRVNMHDLEAWVFDSMAEARKVIPEGLYNTRAPRQGDVPAVVEVWIRPVGRCRSPTTSP